MKVLKAKPNSPNLWEIKGGCIRFPLVGHPYEILVGWRIIFAYSQFGRPGMVVASKDCAQQFTQDTSKMEQWFLPFSE